MLMRGLIVLIPDSASTLESARFCKLCHVASGCRCHGAKSGQDILSLVVGMLGERGVCEKSLVPGFCASSPLHP